jgi:hypothetical protein
VIIAGAGYTLKFTLPALTVGSAATVTAALQATPPAGVPALQSRVRAPKVIGGTPVGLVYLTLSTTAGVGFASLPTFVWTLPSATTIPAGSSGYMAWYDPAVGQWQTHLGPSTPSGTTLTFPGVAGGFSLAANAQYTYALTTNTAVVPTASPAPIPTGSPSPAPAIVPSYCSQFHSYTPPPGGAAPVPLTLTDDSGLNGTLVVYVVDGANYLTGTGSFSSSPVPLPATCYSTTTGSGVTNNPLLIPNPSNGRILFAYAPGTPTASTSTVPNPLPLGNGTPSQANGSGVTLPWDKIEYTIPGGVVDTTQVDFLGLPIEMSLSSTPLPHQAVQPPCTVPPPPSQQAVPTVVGFSSCGELNAFNDLYNYGTSSKPYQPLLLAVPFNGSSNVYVTRIFSEASDQEVNFNWQSLYLAAPAPSGSPCTAANTSYLQCVLAYYKTNPQAFTSNVAGAGGAPRSGQGSVSGDWYCASSDGSTAFVFTDVGQTQPTSCATLTPNASPAPSPTAGATMNPFRMPVALLASAQTGLGPTQTSGCQYNILFEQPYGLAYVDNQNASQQPAWYTATGNLFENNDAFALWKALVADIGYGQAMQAGIGLHPGGQYPPPSPPAYTNLWKDPFFGYYDQVLHHYANGGYTYGTPYDDLYKWFSGYNLPAGASINIRINPLPSLPASFASNSAGSLDPTTCPTVPNEIGSW